MKFFLLLAIISVMIPYNAYAVKKDRHNIEIYSLKMGMSGYVMSFALSELINKHSEMLQASCIESKGSPVNMIILQKHPEKKSSWVGLINPICRYQAQHAITPFKKPYKDVRAIALITQIVAAFATLDPNIKTLNDMVGKRVMINRPNTNTGQLFELFLKDGVGLYDKMKIVRGGMGDAKRALIDGTIDVGWASSVLLTKRADGTWEWVPVPAPGELFQTKKTYVISIPEEVIQKVAKSSGYPLAVGRAAGGHTFGKSTFDEPWTGNLFRSSWYVHKDMPDEIVTEILRVLWENADKFASYHATGKGISKANLPALAEKREFFHPAAIKFYKDRGVEKVGID